MSCKSELSDDVCLGGMWPLWLRPASLHTLCLVHRVHEYCRQEEIWQFISCSHLSPLLLRFIAAAAVCVRVVVFSFPSVFTGLYCVCISRNWSPFFFYPTYTAAVAHTCSTLTRLYRSQQDVCVCACVCVASHPLPPPLVITLMEARSRAAGNQSSSDSNLTERHQMKGWHSVPACCSPPVQNRLTNNHVWVDFKIIPHTQKQNVPTDAQMRHQSQWWQGH